jgi:DNA (cytosine-5)-methyltransferase 1
VGDFGVEMGCGIRVIAASEIIPSRSQLISKNFPETKVFEGDIWSRHDEYISFFRSQLDGKRPWLLTLSPPCQGMSSNGAGRIASSIRSGIRPREDDRNRLILPGISILEKLQPDWFILENVRRMENTVIRNENDEPENILDCIGRRLHPYGYTIRSNILNFSSYGVPHHRERLITIGCRIPRIVKNYPPQEKIYSKELSAFHPPVSHGIDGCPSLISLRNAVGQLPTLDSQTLLVDSKDQLHRVPRWRDNQYFWMKNTPEGQSAFDNFVCIQCSHQNQTKESVTCEKCGEFLPRPTLIRNGEVRLIKGFKTSYRRMKWDSPASTLTMNSGVISSDIKGHPDQNRVLSLREILILSTLDHPRWKKEYSFEGIKYGRTQNEKLFSSKLIREVIGESIPPLAMSCLVNHLCGLE